MKKTAADRQYTPNSPVPGAEPEAVSASLNYWQQTLRDFRREKLAVAATMVVLFVATVAVFCPLIANNRPYYIKMTWTDQYDEDYFVVQDIVRRIADEKTPLGAEQFAQSRKNLERALREMERSLAAAEREGLDELSAMLLSGTEAPARGITPELQRALDEFEQKYDYNEVSLQPYSRWPAFRSLERNEIFFMTFYLLAVPLWFVRHRFRYFWRYAVTCVVAAVAITGVLILIFPPILDNYPYRAAYESETFAEHRDWVVLPALINFGENENLTRESRQPPTWLLPDSARVPGQHYHILGTDTNGRDVLTRMVYGARISMMIGIVAVGIYVTIGILLGSIAGYFGGWTDLMLSRIMEVVICFPVLFLILSVQAYLEPSIINIMVALGLVSWTGVARLQRGEFLRLVNLDFVQAVRALGGSNARIIFRHILPNALGPILVLVSFGMAGSILVESALSFLGFGVPQPTASWGDLLNNGRSDIQGTWWLTVFPGLAIFLTVTCFNLIGEGVRDALDPRRQH